MKLKEWFSTRKERRAAKKREKLVRSIDRQLVELQQLDADTEGIEMPASRFTEEYREFLKEQESAKKGAENYLDER